MYWNGKDYAAVSVSIGDFFDTPVGIYNHSCYPAEVLNYNILYCNWYMPYSNGGRITITNNGEKNYSFSAAILSEKLSVKEASDKMRFCAKWVTSQRERSGSDRWPDAHYFEITGTGRMVGIMMHNYQSVDNCWWVKVMKNSI